MKIERIAALVGAVALGVACGGKNAADPNQVNAIRKQTAAYTDAPYPAKVPTLFRDTSVLPDLDVRSLAISSGRVYAGTPSGLLALRSDGTAFDRVDSVPVADLFATPEGKLLVARADRVDVLSASGAMESTHTSSTSTLALTAVASVEGLIFAGNPEGVLQLDHPGGSRVPLGRKIAVRDLAAWGRNVYVATGSGVLRFDASTKIALDPFNAPRIVDDEVRAVVISGDGTRVIIASSGGVSRIPLDGSAPTTVVPGKQGLANGDLRAVAESNGDLFTGHGIGASSFSAAMKLEHFHSLRWIPAEEVTAVALDMDGTRWIATHAGVSRIALEPTTLAKRADAFEAFFDRHWRMDGFIDETVVYDDPWNLTGKPRTSDDDNDGLWTEMQIGTWCLAYAATKDERYYQSARRAMDVMQLEVDVPAATFQAVGKSPGFITRSLVRDDEGGVFDAKAAMSNWHKQDFSGRTYYWKDDTSSDEYTGHFFGIPLFYDLCAKSESEKAELRTRIKSVMDYLIANQYLLIRLDGQPTTFGRWKDLGAASDGLDLCTSKYHFDVATCIYSNFGGGWLNSTEILGYLLATWHMTGDKKYYDEYERLHTVERYGKMIPFRADDWTVTKPNVANHSDHELATLAYYTLLRYEPNADRRKIWIQSILDFFANERPERNPWQVATIASAVDQNVALDDAMETLREMPLDLREMLYDNSHRVDADLGQSDRGGSPQFTRVFPYDEIRAALWNSNPYSVVGGGDARNVIPPTPYLIAYWMGRYHGLILPP
jgi:hypothetical protein